MTGPPDRMVVFGRKGSVAFAVRANAKAEAQEFLESLDGKSRLAWLALLQRAADHLYPRSPDQYRKLKDRIWEFKRGPFRLLCFMIGNRWYLTHGYRKKTQECPKAEIRRAETILQEHCARRMTGRER